MLHALNPYGFSHLRRANEDNADLNRNFVDFAAPLPVNDRLCRDPRTAASGCVAAAAGQRSEAARA